MYHLLEVHQRRETRLSYSLDGNSGNDFHREDVPGDDDLWLDKS